MARTVMRGRLALVAGLVLGLAITATVTNAAPSQSKERPARVQTRSDAAKAKLAPELQQKLESGTTAKVPVYVALDGSKVAQAQNLLTGAHVARRGDLSLMVGRIGAQQLAKLAGAAGVISVQPVNFAKTGSPDRSDPDGVFGPPNRRTQNENLREFQKHSVPYAKAPPLQTSNFDQLKGVDALDAKTHNFTDAWKAGFTGEGVTASVLDGGTDWGHPDLIGTWQTWTKAELDQLAADGAPVDTNWAGWPKAFDPYDTLVYLLAPDFIDQGLTWYTLTTPGNGTCRPATRGYCTVDFATKTGPSRNIDAAAGTATHTYTYFQGWSKSGKILLGSHPDDHLLALYGERPAFIVTDPHTAGVYDTVYVDLDDNYDFTDDKPVTKSSPVSYRDLNGDGYTDLSGGLLYYISDGNTLIPGGPTDFGVGDTPAPGAFLAWTGDFDPAIEGHGTLTASNVVGQAVINGKAPRFDDLKIKKGKDHVLPGMVLGGAPDTKLAPFGDIYFSFAFSTQFGYLLTNEYGVQVTSNSYGNSDDDNDGMDAASQEADLIHAAIGGNTVTPVFSTGNGAPGFGTATSPSPVRGISVGASTQFGGTGWDSIENLFQITDNDVIEWSNRGPGANGRDGVDVVADGSFSAGDATLNTVIDGRNAWTTWGGTSRSTPVAVGALALVYQAYADANGVYPNALQARSILKSSAKDLDYGSFVQGSGSVDAGKAVRVALGQRGRVTPDEWRPTTTTNGLAAPQPIAPGASATKTFTLTGSGTWNLSDRQLRRYDTETFPFTSAPLAQESVSNFNAPDYLMNITNKIKAHSDADLVVIRANYPRSEFDGNADYQSDQAWRLLAYDWTDLDHDGSLWKDKNGNGVVNHVDKTTSSNIDGFLDIDFGKSEMERGEYERFFYHRPGANTLMGFVRDPAKRMHDGIYLGFQHSTKNAAVDRTHFTVRIEYYKNVDWSWLSTPATASGSFAATFNVPPSAPTGMYEGAIVASRGGDHIVIPVSATVAGTAPQDASGNFTSSLSFAGPAVAASQSNLLYNNGSFFGGNDWTWREESGDWRFYYFDVASAPPPGTLFLTDTTWDDPGAFTDLDTLVFGPSTNEFQIFNPAVVFATPPGYILDTVGASENAYIGSGTWRFNTATGGNEDIVAAPASKGLHAVVQHGVSFNGDKFDVPFGIAVGSATVTPTSVAQTTATGSGSFDVTFKSNVALPGVKAEAFGLSQPSTASAAVKQDNPDDPSTASYKRIDTIQHASRASWSLPNVGGDDLDLFVVYDANNDGTFAPTEIVGSSTGGAGAAENVTLTAPPDGKYQVWIHGFAVSGPHTVPLVTDIVQGNDLAVSGVPAGAVPANTPVTVHVTYSKSPMPAGQYKGELLLGPSTAPTAVTVPITITRS